MAKLIMTIGLPGSGKDYFYLNNPCKDNFIHISSDKIREELLGDINDQSENNLIFSEMHKRTLKALKENVNVYYNATNLSRKKRINFLKQLPFCEKIALVFAIPYEVCCQRNLSRYRTVPEYVMNKMYKSFQPPHYTEGFDKIKIVYDIDSEPVCSLLSKNDHCPHDNPHHSLSCGEHCRKAEQIIEKLIENKNFDSEEKRNFTNSCVMS